MYGQGENDRRPLVAVFYLLTTFIPAGIRYVGIVLGESNLYHDARVRWLPIANQLSNGKVLYVTTMFDNKTPLFHALNYMMYLTGRYALVFYVLVTVANATVAYLLYRWFTAKGHRHVGVVAGFLFLASLPHITGDVINVRSFVLTFLIASLFTANPVVRDGAVGVATLFSQLTVFAIPVIWYDGVRSSDATQRVPSWSLRYASGGLGISVLAFLPLLLWGPVRLSKDSKPRSYRLAIVSSGGAITAHSVPLPCRGCKHSFS